MEGKVTWLDRVIGWLSPQAGYARSLWREEMETQRRGYDAGPGGRLNANWRVVNQPAELEDRYARDTLRARARDLEQNSDMANSVVTAFRRHIVGKGFGLQARTGDAELDDRLEKLWGEWTKAKGCDITGTQNFNQILRMLVTRKKVDGGVLIAKVYAGGGILPLKLQVFEVDELDTTAAKPKNAGNRVVGGIEYNRYNKPVGYYIRQFQVDGMTPMEPRYFPASQMIFYFTKRRPTQVREISDMTPSLTRIRDANEYITAVSVKERIAACLAVMIKKAIPQSGLGRARGTTNPEGTTDYAGKRLSPGMILEMNAGDEAQTINPNGSGENSSSFLKVLMRLVSAGQGLSYEATARDLSGTTYSSARQSMIEDEITYSEEIDILQEMVMNEIYESFVISAVLAGEVDIPDFWQDKQKYFGHNWISPPHKWIDPQKEADAIVTALKTGQKTFQEVCTEQGRDWKETIKDMAEVVRYAKEQGLDVGAIYGLGEVMKGESQNANGKSAAQ